jgi:hypothetical protein
MVGSRCDDGLRRSWCTSILKSSRCTKVRFPFALMVVWFRVIIDARLVRDGESMATLHFYIEKYRRM